MLKSETADLLKSRGSPRFGDFLKQILVTDGLKFDSFQALQQFLKELYPRFKDPFFEENYFEEIPNEDP